MFVSLLSKCCVLFTSEKNPLRNVSSTFTTELENLKLILSVRAMIIVIFISFGLVDLLYLMDILSGKQISKLLQWLKQNNIEKVKIQNNNYIVYVYLKRISILNF